MSAFKKYIVDRMQDKQFAKDFKKEYTRIASKGTLFEMLMLAEHHLVQTLERVKELVAENEQLKKQVASLQKKVAK